MEGPPGQQLFQGLLEAGSGRVLQPEPRVVGVSYVRPAPVEVAVDQGVMGLLPTLQRGVHPLHQEVHHAPVGGVAQEEQLGRRTQGDKETRNPPWYLECGMQSHTVQVTDLQLFLSSK